MTDRPLHHGAYPNAPKDLSLKGYGTDISGLD
jgi:hypothetical protein